MATIEDEPPTDTATTNAVPEGTVMTRRSALKLAGISLGTAAIAGVGVGGVRAATNGAFTAGSGDPYDLWHDRATMSGVDRVVGAGILACNPHNTPAWRFAKRLVAAEPTPDGGVVAGFEDGSSATGDLLVGADGVHSRVRQLIDPATPAPRYVGLVNFGGYTPEPAAGAEPGVWYMIFGRRAFFGYAVDPAGGTVWFANVPRAATSRAEREATTAEQWQRQLLELFADDRGPATQLIAAGTLELAGDNTHDLPRVPNWQRGSMVIVGDAAHAPVPTSGQGASMAAEDAVVLAKCLRDQPDMPQALAAYERLRRPRVERIVAEAARTSSNKTPGPVGRMLQRIMLPLVFKFLVTEKSLAWRYDHHIDWDAPVTLTSKAA